MINTKDSQKDDLDEHIEALDGDINSTIKVMRNLVSEIANHIADPLFIDKSFSKVAISHAQLIIDFMKDHNFDLIKMTHLIYIRDRYLKNNPGESVSHEL